MLSIVLFLLVLCSGSALAAVLWQKRFEETLCITATSIVLVLFLSGLLGHLLAGVVLVCLLAVAVWGFVLVRLAKPAARQGFACCMATPAFLVFGVFVAAVLWVCVGRMSDVWDEFSHWMYIVKAMARVDDFGTNPLAHAGYATYPPGMALFQYFLQKLYQWTTGDALSEWRANFAYNVLGVTFLLPFLRDLPPVRKKPLVTVLAGLTLLVCPMLFFGPYYATIMIDAYVGVLLGAGLAHVFVHRIPDTCAALRIACLCFMLVLAKDVGLLYAIFIGGGYIALVWLGADGRKLPLRKKWTACAMALVSVLAPRMLWNHEIRISKLQGALQRPFDFGLLLRVITGQDTSYRRTVWLKFFSEFVSRPVRVGLPYIVMFAGLLIALAGVLCLRCRAGKISGKRAGALFLLAVSECAVYILGLVITYIMRFSDYEALHLASFERYLNMQCLGLWILTVMLALALLDAPGRIFVRLGLAAAAAVILVVQKDKVYDYVTRGYVQKSVAWRAQYTDMVERIETYTPEESRIWFISEQDDWITGFDSLACRYETQPRVYAGPNSIGEPFFEGDVWTLRITAAEWQKELADGYDYVALYQLNDYFYEHFAEVFTDPEDIAEGAIYAVDHATGKLTRCSP